MRKFKIIILSIFTLLLLVVTIAVVYQNIKNDRIAKQGNKVIDECIYEENQIDNNVEDIRVSSAEIRVSPNAELIIKKFFRDCGHTINETKTVPNDMVNKNQEEIEELYPDYKLESFSNNKIVFLKEEDGQCNEHFLVKDENSEIIIYKILDDGTKEIYQNTGISTEYLPETDKINLKDGVKVYGTENLNSMLEDFE